MVDDLRQWPKWIKNVVKVGIGIVAIGIGVVATGGTGAVPVLVTSFKIALTGSAIGATTNAGYRAIKHRVNTGSWKGAGKKAFDGAIDGAADGFMWGGLSTGFLAYNGLSLVEMGRLKPENKSGNGYYGIKYQIKKKSGKTATRSIEIHPPHSGGPHQYWHLQKNKWYSNEINGPLNYISPDKHWPKKWGS